MRRAFLTVPLRRDPSSRFLPWITAFMVYLAALSLAGIVLIEGAASRWEHGGVDYLTVQYVPPPDAVMTPDAAVASIDLGALAARVAEAMPGARLDDPRDWLAELALLARSLQAVAAAIVLLVIGAAIATVVVTTQMGLAVHREVIEVLHLIGAQDSYVARQFERHALMLGLRGAALGFALALATLYGLSQAAAAIEAPLLPAFALQAWGWGTLGALPLVMALVVMATARLTVLRALARMP
jgi:cell division transport system permease protein